MRKNQTLFLTLIVTAFFAGWILSQAKDETNQMEPSIIKIEEPKDTIPVDTLVGIDDSFSINNFKKYLKQIEIPHPHIVYAIASHESGFDSDLFLATNNMFGMRNPKSRQTTSIHKGSGYARFEHWTHSVDDFFLYMKARGLDELTERQFISRLDQPKYYASKAGYGTRIKKHFDEYLD